MKNEKILKELTEQENEDINRLFLSDKDFEKLGNPSYDLKEEGDKEQQMLYESYKNIVDLLKKYCDLNKQDYPIVASWIIGTYFHDQFNTYPYLFLNAMKGSGKTRTLRLITDLSYKGEILIQPTEAVLFRTNSTLGIDEAEGIARKGMENLRELLNGCYKKGSKVKRMKQKKTLEGVEQVVEEFDTYRPLVLANINGMEDVLGDRCINIILERSINKGIIKLAEIWENEKIFTKTKKMLNSLQFSVVSVGGSVETKSPNLGVSGSKKAKCKECSVVAENIYSIYQKWNDYIYTNYILYTNYTNYTNYTKLFKTLDKMDLNGREVELATPLLFISFHISPEVYEEVYNSINIYMKNRKQDQFNESMDVMLIDMVSQEPEGKWVTTRDILNKYLEFTQIDNKENEITSKWIGVALKRLNLIKERKRLAGGIRYILNISKAQEKIRMFK